MSQRCDVTAKTSDTVMYCINQKKSSQIKAGGLTPLLSEIVRPLLGHWSNAEVLFLKVSDK